MRMQEAAGHVAQHEADMARRKPLSKAAMPALRSVWVLHRRDFGIEVGMRPQRPCAKVISVRVRMLAPSTVIATGVVM